MKAKIITLTLVPTVALTGCDDDPDRHKSKVATPQPAYVQKADGVYKRCPNGAEVPQHFVCTKSTTSTTYAASGSGSARQAKTKDEKAISKSSDKKISRGGFGGKSGGKSGG